MHRSGRCQVVNNRFVRPEAENGHLAHIESNAVVPVPSVSVKEGNLPCLLALGMSELH